jgi:hypothetical protein
MASSAAAAAARLWFEVEGVAMTVRLCFGK